jgi:hypothetical protein
MKFTNFLKKYLKVYDTVLRFLTRKMVLAALGGLALLLLGPLPVFGVLVVAFYFFAKPPERGGKLLRPALILLLYAVGLFSIHDDISVRYLTTKKKTKIKNVQQYNHGGLKLRYSRRVSCDSVEVDTVTQESVDSLYITSRYVGWGIPLYVQEDTVSTRLPPVDGGSQRVKAPILFSGKTCEDTVVTKKYVQYRDHTKKLTKISKTFVNSNWEVITETSYLNKSPDLSWNEVSLLFQNARVQEVWMTYNIETRYRVGLLDETKADTLPTLEEAKETLTKKCKRKSSILGKMVYTEYDACLSHNEPERVYIRRDSVCGTSVAEVRYYGGLIHRRPRGCDQGAYRK